MTYIANHFFGPGTGPRPLDLIRGAVRLHHRVSAISCHFETTVPVGELIKRAETADARGQLELLGLLAQEDNRQGARRFALRAMEYLQAQGYVELTPQHGRALARVTKPKPKGAHAFLAGKDHIGLSNEVGKFVQDDIEQHVDWLFSQHPEYEEAGLDKKDIVNAGLVFFWKRFRQYRIDPGSTFVNDYSRFKFYAYSYCSRVSQIAYVRECQQQELKTQNGHLQDILANAVTHSRIPESRDAQVAMLNDLLLLDCLTDRERNFLKKHLEGMTLDEISIENGFSRKRVSQIINDAKRKLRNKPALHPQVIEEPKQVEPLPSQVSPASPNDQEEARRALDDRFRAFIAALISSLRADDKIAWYRFIIHLSDAAQSKPYAIKVVQAVLADIKPLVYNKAVGDSQVFTAVLEYEPEHFRQYLLEQMLACRTEVFAIIRYSRSDLMHPLQARVFRDHLELFDEVVHVDETDVTQLRDTGFATAHPAEWARLRDFVARKKPQEQRPTEAAAHPITEASGPTANESQGSAPPTVWRRLVAWLRALFQTP